eukprot:406706-Lingulodinium_polyedra.AAC.1
MINGPDCSHLASAGHQRKAIEAVAAWQEENGPNSLLVPLNAAAVWEESWAEEARGASTRPANEDDLPKLIPLFRGPPIMFEIRDTTDGEQAFCI